MTHMPHQSPQENDKFRICSLDLQVYMFWDWFSKFIFLYRSVVRQIGSGTNAVVILICLGIAIFLYIGLDEMTDIRDKRKQMKQMLKSAQTRSNINHLSQSYNVCQCPEFKPTDLVLNRGNCRRNTGREDRMRKQNQPGDKPFNIRKFYEVLKFL